MKPLSEYTDSLITLLAKNKVSRVECEYRYKQLNDAEKLYTENMGNFSDRYYQLAHEINSFIFLSHFGNPKLSSDRTHKAGVDIVLGNYQIECVCASIGEKTEINGFNALCVKNTIGHIVDYSKKEEIMFARLTTVIEAKRDFFVKHCKNGSIKADQPYIVFVGLGALAIEFLLEDNGIDLTSILVGKGNPMLRIDSNSNVIEKGYSHRLNLVKTAQNGEVEIPCNLFLDKKYKGISGIILSSAILGDAYECTNTWLYINPLADNPINPDDFMGLSCWKINERNEYMFYENK